MSTRSITLRSLLRYGSLVTVVGLLTLYALFQSRLIIAGPEITLEPIESNVTDARQVELSGTAENITRITLNGRDIYTDKNGYFKEVIVLENGYTIATVEGFDRYGRTEAVTQSFIYRPLATSTNQ